MNAIQIVLLLMFVHLFGACATTSLPLGTPINADAEAAIHNDEGIQFYRQGQWEAAKEHFEDAILAGPDLAEPHYNLALTLDQLGSHARATSHFKEAAALGPTNTAITKSRAYTSHVEIQ
jgi:Tfp pilus assembly protein PilF